MFVIQYLIRVRPNKEPLINRTEIINEIMVLIAAYPLFCFTEFILVEERQ